MDNFIVTIARGFGSGGKRTAFQLAKDYGIECYESRILTLASQLSGIETDKFIEIDERLREKKAFDVLKKLPFVKNTDAVFHKFVSDQLLFDYQAKIIQKLAESKSCVIVGKCADFVLKDYKNVVSVYIEAPREYTRERIMNLKKVPAEIADDMITRTDKYRADYYEAYTNGNYWTNPVNYDLTLNSSTLGIEGCVYMIKHCLKQKLGVELPKHASE
ncbi:MAG: cytidylate kinase-like family protein [Spirochaetales bacterium]|nr:cytidylate kinase-like family protein [Spirochaetales bacterium]